MRGPAAEPAPRWHLGWWLATALPLVLAAVPPWLLVRAVVRDTVAVPWRDQWSFAREEVRVRDGTFRAADLWIQHNEHRVPLTKVVLHALAAATGWDVRWEVAANVIVALALILLLARMLRRTVPAWGSLVLVASALQCSLVQWQNWTWGWQLGVFLAEACAIGLGAVLVRAPAAPTPWAVVAVLVAIAGALSNGAGLVLLAVVPLGLLLLRLAGVRVPAATIAGAVVAAALTASVYASGWVPAMGQPRPTPIAGHVLGLLGYALTLLGGPIVSWDLALAWRWGLVVCVAVAAAAIVAWANAPDRRTVLVPWMALAAFAIGASLLIAVGRLGAGTQTALLSRYATYAVPMWIAVGPLVVLAVGSVGRRAVRVMARALVVPLLLLAAWHAYLSWVRGDALMAARASVAREAAACIAEPAQAPDACWRVLCWDPSYAREAALMLQAHRLGPWAR